VNRHNRHAWSSKTPKHPQMISAPRLDYASTPRLPKNCFNAG
jgi:hypothetical protein